MNVYRVGYSLPNQEPASRIVVASSMVVALNALSQALPNATAAEVRLLGTGAIIVP